MKDPAITQLHGKVKLSEKASVGHIHSILHSKSNKKCCRDEIEQFQGGIVKDYRWTIST